MKRTSKRIPKKEETETESDTQPPPTLEIKSTSRWRTMGIRTLSTLLMFLGFYFVIRAGHLWMIILIMCVQGQIYREVISIASLSQTSKEPPLTQVLS